MLKLLRNQVTGLVQPMASLLRSYICTSFVIHRLFIGRDIFKSAHTMYHIKYPSVEQEKRKNERAKKMLSRIRN